MEWPDSSDWWWHRHRGLERWRRCELGVQGLRACEVGGGRVFCGLLTWDWALVGSVGSLLLMCMGH